MRRVWTKADARTWALSSRATGGTEARTAPPGWPIGRMPKWSGPDVLAGARIGEPGVGLLAGNAQSAAGVRVLIADGYADAADSLETLVRLWGYQTRIAYTGPAALALADSFRPHILLAEIILPELDGYQLARRLQDRVPVCIALTTLARAQDHSSSREAGFQFHLVKPAEPDVLAALLAVVGRRLCLHD